jgi:hypothetical protein
VVEHEPDGLGANSLRKHSLLHLILGGAAVYRCVNCTILNAASAAAGATLVQERLFSVASLSGAANNAVNNNERFTRL